MYTILGYYFKICISKNQTLFFTITVHYYSMSLLWMSFYLRLNQSLLLSEHKWDWLHTYRRNSYLDVVCPHQFTRLWLPLVHTLIPEHTVNSSSLPRCFQMSTLHDRYIDIWSMQYVGRIHILMTTIPFWASTRIFTSTKSNAHGASLTCMQLMQISRTG